MDQSRHVLKRALAMLLVFALVFSYGFNANTITAEAASAKYVTKVTVAKKKLTVQAKKSATVKVTIKGSKGVSKAYTVKSNKPAIASVKKTSKGVKITGKKAGKATIVITTKAKTKKNKQLKAKIAVTVKAAPKKTTQATTQATTAAPTVAPTQAPTQAPTKAPEVLKKITVAADPTTITEKGGQTKVSVASDPAGIALASVTYESSNEQIATVKNGVVTGVNPGKVTIKVVAKDAQGNVAEGSVEITVTEANAIKAKITFSGDLTTKGATLAINETKTFSPTVEAETNDYEVVWTSSKESVATVTADGTAGVVKAVGKGSATITATVKGTNASQSFTVTVDDNIPAVKKFTAAHADTVTVEFTTAVKEADRDKVNFELKFGDNPIAFTTEWADDGKSVNLKHDAELSSGTYSVKVTSDEVAIDPTNNSSSTTIEKRDVARVNILTKNIPYVDRAKVLFEVLDQYDDVMKNVKPSEFKWIISCNSDAVDVTDALVDQSNNGFIYVKSNYKALKPGTDKFTIKASYGKDGVIFGSQDVRVDYLKVQSIKITGINASRVWQKDTTQNIEMNFEAKDQFGNDVDMERYFEDSQLDPEDENRAYLSRIQSWTEDDTKVTAPEVTEDGKLIVKVKPNQFGKVTVRVRANDQVDSTYDVEVFKAREAQSIKFPEKGKHHVAIGGETKIPVTFVDQYGEDIEAGITPYIGFTSLFNVAVSGNTAFSARNIYATTEDDQDYLVVSARSLSDQDKKDVNFTFISKEAGTVSTYTLEVVDRKNANKIEITNKDDVKTTLMVRESTEVKFKIYDNDGQPWIDTDTYELKVENPADTFISVSTPVINSDGTGSFKVYGKANTSETDAKKITIKLLDRAGNSIATKDEEFTFKVVDNVSSISAKVAEKTYKAGQKVKITLTAMDNQSTPQKLTSYNATLKNVDVKVSNSSTSFENFDEIAFVNGVATIEVTATVAGKDVYYYADCVSPDDVQMHFNTNNVTIEADDASKLGVDYSGTTLSVSYLDVRDNIDENKSATKLKIKITNNNKDVTKDYLNNQIDTNGWYVLSSSEPFENGVVRITLKNSIPETATVTVTDGTLSGEK